VSEGKPLKGACRLAFEGGSGRRSAPRRDAFGFLSGPRPPSPRGRTSYKMVVNQRVILLLNMLNRQHQISMPLVSIDKN